MPYKPVMLIIMDGFGIGDGSDPAHDATVQARTPCLDRLKAAYPYTTLEASGGAVGLPEGQMGNSEVGHLNIGAGRVVYQDLTRINLAVRDGSIMANAHLLEACQKAKAESRPLHLLGLVSNGGVHSQMSHLYALLELAKSQSVPQVYVHALLDGRDTPPQSALGFIRELEERMSREGLGRIATVGGRYYTMDRDKRWDRVEKGYRALAYGQGLKAASAVDAVLSAYGQGVTDEFIEPTVIVSDSCRTGAAVPGQTAGSGILPGIAGSASPAGGLNDAYAEGAFCSAVDDGQPLAVINDGDPLIMFNFRTDRLREICHAFTDRDFPYFSRKNPCRPFIVTMTQYEACLPVKAAFPPQNLENTLGQTVAWAGGRQLRIAETEKYAHVTFFFNGGVDVPNEKEDRILIPSPKVATYDMQPEMSAPEVGAAVNEQILSGKYDLIILNYANPDMVGHTGVMTAAIKAVETVDYWVGKNVAAVLQMGGAVLVTADHGNAETMWDPRNNSPQTCHSCRPVPCILAAEAAPDLRSGGALCDLAPTILELMGIVQPPEMTGRSLIRHQD